MTVEERLARLEALEEIRMLKHRYFRACDAKDPEGMRACFVAEGADIYYGPALGSFDDADGLVEVYARLALERLDDRYVILDMHHGMHPSIEITGEGTATGAWTLRFRQVDLRARTERVSALDYDDDYVVEDDRWKIARCHVRVHWSIERPLTDDAKVVH
ncbi:bile acid 7-alpha dehydratase [Rhodococcus ruber Chol-4]|uniref:nuclear transport factor 2 family protein n=1 Tax=Rhodococcus TaxID=1827 RepID=UPI00034B2607|nr:MULTISPECIES: nuclear transport factor 2 family protein [Rhodococcus]AUM18190.1 nuclear transport factor 2 family protein [Rhodococcus ruber]AWH00646.1 nuclear transport factor 2 family protein [Rhodococcus ruber]KXF83760.1 bile acid 7-alpha dehydratase [Rhodococcus ruber Chol-4]MDO1481879.1 nuclear transport factor 2 family protein [Rhodococcus ruber]